MSGVSYSTDTRFGKAEDFIKQIEDITGKKIIHTICGAEPIGPKMLLDALVIAPCTGNTLGKMANGITDTSVPLRRYNGYSGGEGSFKKFKTRNNCGFNQ